MSSAVDKSGFLRRFSEASARTSAAAAYSTIKQRILENTYGPNTTVTVQELSVELGMSRTPIRDALIRLEQERFVEITPRHGFRVLPMRPEEMLEVYQLVAGLECIAIQLVLNRGLRAEELERLRAAGQGMRDALEADDLDAWLIADGTFHRLLIDFCDNQALRQVALAHTEQIWRARDLTLRIRPKPVRSTQSHCEVIEAMAAGDLDTATRVHWEQRQRSSLELTNILARMNIRHL